MRIQNCGVLLTGASGGIGRALALELARRQCRMVLVARREAELLSVAEEVRACGGQVMVLPGNVADAKSQEEVARKAAPFLAPWRVVLANAGVGFHGAALECSSDAWERVMQVNLHGAIATLRAAYPWLQRPGVLGVMSSLSALIPYRGGAVYAASKAGLNAFLRCLRLEAARDQMVVGWLCPGPVATPMIVEGVPLKKLPPLARMTVPVLSPQRVARAFLRLLERGGGEKVIPLQAAFFASFYRHFPRTAEKVLRLFGAGEV
ncbi:MAG: SDR family NAD(P)-dependent oxidoreductase [Thermoanaerobaculaceae bacterium]